MTSAAQDLRVPPHDPTAERAVICAALADGATMPEELPGVARVLAMLRPEAFYCPLCAAIWRAILTAHERGERPEYAILAPMLNSAQRGVAAECAAITMNPANIQAFAARVQEAAQRRALLVAAQRISDAAHDGTALRGVEALALEVAQVAGQAGAAASKVAHAWRPIEQALSEPDPELAALWPGIVFRGAFTLFAAMPKTGKTWLLIAWIAELVRGGAWLGFAPLHQSIRVLLVTEEPLFIVKAQARMFGIERDVDVLTLDGVAPGTSWSALVAAAAERAAETGAELVLFDTISTLAGMEDENSASDVNAALRPLLMAAREHDLAVVGVHHAAKSGGIRGSTVFEAVPDVLVEVGHGKTKRRRVLTVRSRLEGAPEDPVKVEWLPPMGEFVAGYRLVAEQQTSAGEVDSDRIADLDERIMHEVEQATAGGRDWITTARIVERIGGAAGRVRGRLPALVRAGRLAREDGPGRGGPYVYGMPDGPAEPVTQDEPVPNLSHEPVQPAQTCPSPVPCGSEAGSPNLSNLSRGAVSPRTGTGASSGTRPLRAIEAERGYRQAARPGEPEDARDEGFGLLPSAPLSNVDPAEIGRNPDGSRRRASRGSAP